LDFESAYSIIRGSAGKSTQARLTLNARVEMSPETLEQIVRETLSTKVMGYLKKTFHFLLLKIKIRKDLFLESKYLKFIYSLRRIILIKNK
jgi:hypothetical protein